MIHLRTLQTTPPLFGMSFFLFCSFRYPQVYADISVINWIIPRDEFHAYVQALIRAGLGKRVIFGSDQMIWPETIGMAVEAVQSIPGITESQKRDIFYNNAVRFFRLNERELKSWQQ